MMIFIKVPYDHHADVDVPELSYAKGRPRLGGARVVGVRSDIWTGRVDAQVASTVQAKVKAEVQAKVQAKALLGSPG